jgi:hypothetical protein
MLPRILLGAADGSSTRLSAIHSFACAPPALWSKRRSVSCPTLKVVQERIALSSCCVIVTCFRPPSTISVGLEAPCHVASSATSRPPAPRPFGTPPFIPSAAARAPSWAACTARIASSARRSGALACCTAVWARVAAAACAAAAWAAAASGDIAAFALPARRRMFPANAFWAVSRRARTTAALFTVLGRAVAKALRIGWAFGMEDPVWSELTSRWQRPSRARAR